MFALMLVLTGARAAAETFFAASVRTHANSGPNAAAGMLYTIDPDTAAATVVAPIRLGGSEPIGITGLAVQPGSGVFFGITGRLSPAVPHSLVKIDPASGDATLVGELEAVGSDIGFSSNGTLYTWLPELRQLATLDLGTGKATPIGAPGAQPADGAGALAIDANDTGYVAATGATGTLDRLDLRTGARTRGPKLTGAPYPSAIINLSFSPSGKLFAVNASSGAPADTVLVAIDPASGVVSTIGRLPSDVEALIFASVRVERPYVRDNWMWISTSLALTMLAGIIAMLVFSSRSAAPSRGPRK
jgi:hypothetical protein